MRVRQAIRTFILAGAGAAIAAAQIKPADPNPEATSGAIQRRVAPPARINSFTAQPASIQPGQQTTLAWSVENPAAANIDPEVGRVRPRGSQVVKPAATTTYTLNVQGPNNQVLTKQVTVTVAGTKAVSATAAAGSKKEVPRLANGKPDLSGVYDSAAAAGGGRGAAAAPVLKPGAEKYRVVRGPDDTGLTSDCMPLAPPQAFNVPYQLQLVASAHSLAILHEYPGTFRTIPTDGGPHQVDPDPTWMGDSVAHWEGDTLVIDTIGFNDKTEIGGYKHTEALHIVERLTRSDYDTVQYEATLEDPNVFAQPWKMTRRFVLRPELQKVDEFVCEHNEDYHKFFKKE